MLLVKAEKVIKPQKKKRMKKQKEGQLSGGGGSSGVGVVNTILKNDSR